MVAYTVGWVYNLHDESATTRASQLIAVALAFPIIALFAVVLRFYMRLRQASGRTLGGDDWTAVWSLVFGVGYSIIAIYQTRWGQALSAEYFPAENLIPFNRVQYAGGPTYCLALLGFKLSMLFAYLRIAGIVRKARLVIYIVMALVTANQLAFTFVLSFACHPIAKQWDASIPGTCIDTLASYYALGGSSLGFDILIILLPMPTLYNLQLHWKKKLGLACMLALGLFVTLTQAFRIFTIANLKNYTDSFAIVVWSIIEINVGIFVSCIPSYAPLFRFAREKLTTSGNKDSSRKYGQGSIMLSSFVEVSRSKPTPTVTHVGADNESEEAIIHEGTGIKATTEWKFEYEDLDSPDKGSSSRKPT